MRVARQVSLTDEQQRTLQQWARARSLPSRQVERARVVLLAAAGKQDLEIARGVGISNQKVARWRKRFLKRGAAGLQKDAPSPWTKADDDAGTGAGGRPEDHAGETFQRNALEHAHYGKAAEISEKGGRRICHRHGRKP